MSWRFAEVLAVQRQFRPGDADAEAQRAVAGGTSPLTTGGIFAAWSTWHLGYPTQAIERAEEVVRDARLVRHPHSLAFGLTLAAVVRRFTRQFDTCLALAEEARQLAIENDFALWIGVAGLTAAHARSMLGDPQVDAVMSGMQGSGSTGNRAGIAVILAAAAEVQRAAGDHEAALGMIDLAFQQATPIGMFQWHSDLHRLRGEIQADEQSDPGAAEASFREGLEFARDQEAKSNELRLATSYGRLLRDQGRGKEAHALLAPVYEWFSEGHELPDLVDAKDLLEELLP